MRLTDFTQRNEITMAPDNKHPQKNVQQTVTDDIILKVSKEIVIKFIEVGRVTPSTFDDTFKKIHTTIKQSVDK